MFESIKQTIACLRGQQYICDRSGLDEVRALYEWEYGKQRLHTQILRDKIGQLFDGIDSLHEAVARLDLSEDVFFSSASKPSTRPIRWCCRSTNSTAPRSSPPPSATSPAIAVRTDGHPSGV